MGRSIDACEIYAIDSKSKGVTVQGSALSPGAAVPIPREYRGGGPLEALVSERTSL